MESMLQQCASSMRQATQRQRAQSAAATLAWIALLLALPQSISGSDGCGDDWDDVLKLHNDYRALHGSPPLKLSKRAQENSQYWAEYLVNKDGSCSVFHSGTWSGENIYGVAGVTNSNGRCIEATKIWYNEEKTYKFTSKPFSDNPFKRIGHFTQMVWESTKTVGCGMANRNGCNVVVCQYDGPGNWQSNAQFLANVHPPSGGKVGVTGSLASPPPKKGRKPPAKKGMLRRAF